MEAKINFENIQNEDQEKIMTRYKELAADSGDVYAWQFGTENPPSARTFSSEKNAKEYEVLLSDFPALLFPAVPAFFFSDRQEMSIYLLL